ncbi:2OG-Fe dioxygenase family protein [Kineosporia mesophila]|uniref:2OG-Fe dioxygenase family protein n=1 Tax=Kineosporia mesophila TaxID=566012 RepID=A0ABP7AM82_9ACTN|nr:2OG-Fe dioxygenase family protein [Kineosporia mesophila]MCD5353964.1 2OG-Fe dioxygenase family protein [Kineosporia mesophila]
MTTTTETTTAAPYVDTLATQGYAHIPADHYYDTVFREHSLEGLRADYLALESEFGRGQLDPYSPGSRYRSYAQLRVDPGSADFEYGLFEQYRQTKAYNPDTGGVVREYPLISPELQENRLLRRLLRSDVEFLRAYPRVDADPSQLSVGLHLFRYLAYAGEPAYSSPNWLHKDDETVVFIHLVGLSGNVVGGDNLIAPNAKRFENVLRLTDPFDTLVVNQDKLHAVTPIGTTSRNPVAPARRDILLVTFQVRDPG